MAGWGEGCAAAIGRHRAGSLFARERHECSLRRFVAPGRGVEGVVVGLVGVEVALHLPLQGVRLLGSVLAAAVSGAEGARVGDVCAAGMGVSLVPGGEQLGFALPPVGKMA